VVYRVVAEIGFNYGKAHSRLSGGFLFMFS
jgi:hypothetical protein